MSVQHWKLLEANELSSDIILLKKPTSELTREDFKMASSEPHLDAVVGEPFFSSSLLPWHNLHYWYSLCNLRKFMKPECAIVPGVIELKAIAGTCTCSYNDISLAGVRITFIWFL